jgi:glycopeptide antibiotics resistance protein
MQLLKKILVWFPVMLLTVFYLYDHYGTVYRQASAGRLFLFGLTILVLYAWIIGEVLVRKQRHFLDIGIQASYYVYVFMVLTLTGYFILFRDISVHSWWQDMAERIANKDHVNLKLFRVFRIYKLTDRQLLGNLVMLLPLGIYLPLLYRWASNFWSVVLGAMVVSSVIELLQLATSYRSTDVDDVFLNTVGAAAGYAIYRFFHGLVPAGTRHAASGVAG